MDNTQKYQPTNIVKAFKNNKSLNCVYIFQVLVLERERQEHIFKEIKYNNAETISFINKYKDAEFNLNIKPIILRIAGLALMSIEINNSEEIDTLSKTINESNNVNDLFLEFLPYEKLTPITFFSALRHLISKADLMIFNGTTDKNLIVITKIIFMAAICALNDTDGNCRLLNLD